MASKGLGHQANPVWKSKREQGGRGEGSIQKGEKGGREEERKET